MTETVPKLSIPLCVSIMFLTDQGLNNIVPTTFFYYISNNWYWLYLFHTIIISVPQAILCHFLPDSPAVYYEE